MASWPDRPPPIGPAARRSPSGWRRPCIRTMPATFRPRSIPAIHRAALAACDALDGVEDGVIENPPACKFDPAVLPARTGTVPTA